MIKLHDIASGSKGNACLIYNDKTLILIDMGLTKVRLSAGLAEIGKTIDDIDFALFTHEHADHISGERFIDSNKKYSLEGTITLQKANILENYKEYSFNEFKITPLKTSHDATNPCGFLIEENGEKLVYMTDTGKILKKSLALMENADYYFIESNHDLDMLNNSGRPRVLINRIAESKGHLSNEDSAYFMTGLVGPKTKKIMLAHLSEECNTEELALETYKRIFALKGIKQDIEIKCAKQRESVDL